MQTIPNPHASQEGKTEFKNSPTSGVVSTVRFTDSDFWNGLAKTFSIAENEELIGVTITDTNIQARIRTKESRIAQVRILK